MTRLKTTLVGVFVISCSAWAFQQRPTTPAVTIFEGARLIVGDGRAPIENGAFVVDGARITQVGRANELRAPAGAARVNLAGKTVMPAIIDTHTHLSQTREALIDDLRRRPYYGVSAAMSLGQDRGDLPFQIRAETIPGAARFRRSRAARIFRTGSRRRQKAGKPYRNSPLKR
jgi:hypothetical protein